MKSKTEIFGDEDKDVQYFDGRQEVFVVLRRTDGSVGTERREDTEYVAQDFEDFGSVVGKDTDYCREKKLEFVCYMVMRWKMTQLETVGLGLYAIVEESVVEVASEETGLIE